MLPVAHAQVSVRVGGSRIALPGSSTSAATIAPRFDWRGSGAQGFVEVAGSAFDGGSLFQLTVRDARTRGIWASEATLEAGVISDGTSTGRLQQAFGAGHRVGPLTASAGLSGGVLRDIGGTFRPQASGRLGLSWWALDLKAQRFDAGARFRYNDLAAQVTVPNERGLLAAAAGVRVFDHRRRQVVYRADLVARLSRILQLELSVGRSPRSPEGFSEGTYYMAGLRASAVPAVHRPEITRSPMGTRVTFELRGSQVAIAGDWNDWANDAMTRDADGRWSIVIPAGTGAHRFTLTIDGKTVVPRGVPKLPDGFGGEVGLLVIG